MWNNFPHRIQSFGICNAISVSFRLLLNTIVNTMFHKKAGYQGSKKILLDEELWCTLQISSEIDTSNNCTSSNH
jgi:hypothetical protein